MPSGSLICKSVGAKAFNVIPRPPEAEAVKPQMILTESASVMIGLGEIFKIVVWIPRKIGRVLMTLPYPTIALELSNGINEFLTPISRMEWIFFSFLIFSKRINRIAMTIEIITLYVPDMLSSVVLKDSR